MLERQSCKVIELSRIFWQSPKNFYRGKTMPEDKLMYYDGTNYTDHYNFTIVDNEILYVRFNNKIIPSALQLTLEEIGLYTVIKSFAMDKNFSFPSLNSLSKLFKIGKPKLIELLKSLERKGLIQIKKMNPKMIKIFRKNTKARMHNYYIINRVDKEEITQRSVYEYEDKAIYDEVYEAFDGSVGEPTKFDGSENDSLSVQWENRQSDLTVRWENCNNININKDKGNNIKDTIVNFKTMKAKEFSSLFTNYIQDNYKEIYSNYKDFIQHIAYSIYFNASGIALADTITLYGVKPDIDKVVDSLTELHIPITIGG